jgi:hypothetical protein
MDAEILSTVIATAIKAAIAPYAERIAAAETRAHAAETRLASIEARPALSSEFCKSIEDGTADLRLRVHALEQRAPVPGPSGEKGDPGAPGRDGRDAQRGKAFSAGEGAPSGEAESGDVYLDLASGDVYRCR